MRFAIISSFVTLSAMTSAFAQPATELAPSCLQRIKTIAETMATLNERHLGPTYTVVEGVNATTYEVTVSEKFATRMGTFRVTLYAGEDCRLESVTDMN